MHFVLSLSQMVVGESSNSTPALVSRGKDEPAAEAVSDQNSLPDESTISAFMSQVSDLIKCVTVFHICEKGI